MGWGFFVVLFSCLVQSPAVTPHPQCALMKRSSCNRQLAHGTISFVLAGTWITLCPPPLGLALERMHRCISCTTKACIQSISTIFLEQFPAYSIIPYKAVPYMNIFAVLFWTFHSWLHPFWEETSRTVHLHQDLNVAQCLLFCLLEHL